MSEPGGRSGLLWAGVAVVLGGAGAGAAWYLNQPAPQPVVAPATQAALPVPSDDAAGTPDAPQTTEDAGQTDQSTEVASDASDDPRLEEVRVEADGLAVMAGTARPGSEVILRLDGVEVARATADAAGAFATVAFLDPSADARVLTIFERTEDGQELESSEDLILAPVRVANRPASTEVVETESETETEIETSSAEQTAAPAPIADRTDLTDTADAAPSATEETPKPEEVAAVETPKAPAPQETAVADPTGSGDASDQVAALSTEAPDLEKVEAVPPRLPDDSATSEAELPTVSAQVAPQIENDVETVSEPAPDTAPQVASTTPAVQDPAPATNTAAVTERPDVLNPPRTAPLVTAPPQPDLVTSSLAPEGSGAAQASPPPGDLAAVRPAAAAPTALAVPVEDETQQIAVIKSNKDGVQVVQPITPSADELRQIALDTISYSTQGAVQLAGRAQSTAQEVRVYLDNQPIAVLGIDKAGDWRAELPDIDSGVYTLRLDELDEGGKVTSRVETPFKREEPEVLAAALGDSDASVKAITVQKGNTLWAIARERYGEGVLYVRVFEANRDSIRNPDLIYPGQVFSLPEE